MISKTTDDGVARSGRWKRALGAGAAMAAAFTATGSLAQVSGSTTSVKVDAVVGGSVERHVFTGGEFQSARNRNDATIDFSTFDRNSGAPFVTAVADTHVSQGKLSAGVEFLGTFDQSRGQSISTASASVTVTDSLKISSTGGDGRVVTLHKILNLTDFGNNEINLGNFVENNKMDEGDDFLAFTSDKLQISGTGIGPSVKGNDTFLTNLHDQEPDFTSVFSLNPPATIDFTLNFTLGEAQFFDINMLMSVIANINDRDGSMVGRSGISANFELAWADGGTLTDALTGEAVCGASSVSDSRFNYLRGIVSSPCDVGGGGGDGGGGGGDGGGSGGGGGAGGVPEPTSWALMIVGFGGVGAALRRRGTVTA